MGAVHHDLRGVETLRAGRRGLGLLRTQGRRTSARGMAMCDRAPVGGEGTLKVTLSPDGTVHRHRHADVRPGHRHLRHANARWSARSSASRPTESASSTGRPAAVEHDSGIGGMRATRVNTDDRLRGGRKTRSTALLALAAEHLGWPADRLVLRGDGDQSHRPGRGDSLDRAAVAEPARPSAASGTPTRRGAPR